jgi:hypothetical protein
MLDFIAIGPGPRTGIRYAGYFRPGTRTFVPLVDCLTREQADAAAADLRQQAVARALASTTEFKRGVVRGFYDDEGQI